MMTKTKKKRISNSDRSLQRYGHPNKGQGWLLWLLWCKKSVITGNTETWELKVCFGWWAELMKWRQVQKKNVRVDCPDKKKKPSSYKICHLGEWKWPPVSALSKRFQSPTPERSATNSVKMHTLHFSYLRMVRARIQRMGLNNSLRDTMATNAFISGDKKRCSAACVHPHSKWK